MDRLTYDSESTALLVIDPYNDFISEGGKVWDRLQAVANANDCVAHMVQASTAARSAGLRVFYALHRRYRPGDYETWKHLAPIQRAAWTRKTFEYGTWGGEILSFAKSLYAEHCNPSVSSVLLFSTASEVSGAASRIVVRGR